MAANHTKTAQHTVAGVPDPIIGLLLPIAMQAFKMEGYYPRSYPAWLRLKKATVARDARFSDIISRLQAIDNDRLASIIVELVKNDEEAKEIAKSVLEFLYFIAPDTADAVLHPVGSMRELGASIGGSIVDIAPEIDRDTARQMSEYIVWKIREDFYNEHVMRDANKRILTNGGFTAGRFGEVYLSLVNSGMLDPRWDWNSQKAVLSKYVPAISAVIAYQNQRGQEVGVMDAIKVASEFNSALAASQRDDKDLTRNIMRVMEVNNLMLARVGSGKPGALPIDKAAEENMKLLDAASRSQLSQNLAMIRMASKYAKPDSPVSRMAEMISNGVPPISSTKEFYSISTSDGLYNLMVKSGVKPKMAWAIITNPDVADQYKDHSVVTTTRALQRYEILRTIEMNMAAVKPYIRSLPPEGKEIALQSAKLYALRQYGIKNEAQFEQLHGRLGEGELARAMYRAEERLRHPPEPYAGLGQTVGKGLQAIKQTKPKTPHEAIKAFISGAMDITPTEYPFGLPPINQPLQPPQTQQPLQPGQPKQP